MSSLMPRLHWVWFALLALFAGLATVTAVAHDPELVRGPRVVALVPLLAAYLGWDWIIGVAARPWQVAQRRRVLAWGGNLALTLGLLALSHDYAILLWILFGRSFSYLRMPAALLGAGVPLAVLAGGELYQSGWHAPHGAGNWATAGMGVVVVATWFMVGMTLDRLFTVRAANEALIAELRASQEQLQHAAEQERELALLRERERLARDLHDVVGNALVLAAVKLEAAQRLARADRERACAELDATKHLLRRTMTELRAAVTSLRSAPGDDRPLDVALAEDARELTRDAGVRLWLACPAIEGLTPAQDEALRRVAREALMNVVKHARASEVGVSLEERDGRVTLEITDNGRGLPPDSTQAGHYGLCGMRERMELVGGRLALLPRPGGGLCVRAELPLAASAAAALVSHAAD